MKPEKKNQALRGIGIGIGVFALLSAVCLLTPLRKPILAATGRDTPALEYRLQTQRDTLDALQTRASSARLSPAERASLESVRDAYVATRERIDARARMNSRLSLLGLFDWIQELFPWLLAFGLALPVLGGLIGAQAGAQMRANPDDSAQGPHKAAAPLPARPVPSAAPAAATPSDRPAVPPPRPVVAPVRTGYVHPAAAAAAAAAAPATPAATPVVQRPLPGSPVILPPDTSPQDWGFRHQPTPLESRPRPKLPPIRSPHALGEPEGGSASEEAPSDENQKA